MTIIKLNRFLYCINKVKNFLPKPALKSYYVLVHSHLSYCPTVTTCASAKNIFRIALLQKKADIFFSGNQFHAHTNPIFKEYEIFSYTSHFQYSKLLFRHSIVYKYCPKSLLDMWQNKTDRDKPHDLRNQGILNLHSLDQNSLKTPTVFITSRME